MTDEMPTTRAYHSPLRQEQAALTRSRVIEAAASLFEERGYGGATVALIAEAAGVSVDTVVSVGPKSDLLLEGFRVRAMGEGGPQGLLERSFAEEIFAITDPVAALDAVVAFMAGAHQGSARLWMLIRATAVTDPMVAEVFAELRTSRDQSYDLTVAWLAGLGALAGGRPIAPPTGAAAVRARVVLSAENYVQLVDDYRFGIDDYRAWLTSSLAGFAG